MRIKTLRYIYSYRLPEDRESSPGEGSQGKDLDPGPNPEVLIHEEGSVSRMSEGENGGNHCEWG